MLEIRTDTGEFTQDFKLLVVDTFGPKTLDQIEKGELPPPTPEHLCQEALDKAKDHFAKAVTAPEIDDILLDLALCRQLLDDLKAKFGDLGVTREQVQDVEQRLKSLRAAKPKETDPITLQHLDDYISVCLKGNQRYLD